MSDQDLIVDVADEALDQQKKCLKCRECCEYVEYPVTMLSTEAIEYFIFRGEQMYIDPAGVLMVRQHKPCKYLTEAGCSIYENRPEACREFMCEYKDTRIKAAKLLAIQTTMEQLKQSIDNLQGKRRWEPILQTS